METRLNRFEFTTPKQNKNKNTKEIQIFHFIILFLFKSLHNTEEETTCIEHTR